MLSIFRLKLPGPRQRLHCVVLPPTAAGMPQPTSPAYMVAFNVTKNKGTPDEYHEVETRSMTEAGIWLEWLPGDDKWVQIPVICTEAIQGKYFRVADIQSAVATTFHALKGKYIKVFSVHVLRACTRTHVALLHFRHALLHHHLYVRQHYQHKGTGYKQS